MRDETQIENQTILFERKILKDGYVRIKVDGKFVYEHRYIIERWIGRELLPEEVIHHISEIKSDNRISNLFLFSCDREHIKFHNRIKRNGMTRTILREIEHRWDKYIEEKNDNK